MRVMGLVGFEERVLGDVAAFETELSHLDYPVHLEQMGYDIDKARIGDYYYEEDALLLWLCRCYEDRERCRLAVDKFVDLEVDLIVAMTPPALKMALAATRESAVPILFTHVTYPSLDADLRASMETGGRVTGVRDVSLEVVEERLALIDDVVPTPTTIHSFYNPGRPAAKAEAVALQEAGVRLGLDVELYAARSPREVKVLLQELRTRNSHAILRLADPSLAGAAGLLGAAAHEQCIPYVAPTLEETERCNALFALEVGGVGREAAALADRILKGTDPADLPIVPPERKTLAVNLQAAQDLGLVVSPAVQERAQVVMPARERTSLSGRLLLALVAATAVLTATIVMASGLGPVQLVTFTAGVAVVLIVSLWLVVRRSIIQPIQRLTFTAERIGAGELNVAIGDVRVEDEIGILSRALRRMRSNLINSYAELEKMADSLERRVDELTEAYRALRDTQLELELASRRIVEADDSARFALTTYIHDEILGLVDQLGTLAADLDSPALSELTGEMDHGIRRLRYDLSVPILRNTAVELRRLVRETLPEIYPEAQEVLLSLDLAALERLPQLRPASAVLIYRFTQGAVSNAFRHAEAGHIRIQASRRDGELSLSVSDDGRGFDPGLVEDFIHQGHYFFHDVQIRAKQLEGSFSIHSQPGTGTRVEIVVPVEEGVS